MALSKLPQARIVANPRSTNNHRQNQRCLLAFPSPLPEGEETTPWAGTEVPIGLGPTKTDTVVVSQANGER